MATATVGLVHLVRAANRLESFRAFLDAYRSHPAHIDHELLLLFKGFHNGTQIQPYKALLHDTPYRAMYLADVGFDIGPYAVAAHRFEHRYFCFLNSFSAPLADGWLASLYRQLLRPGVGLVGASGSWESAYTNVLTATVLHQMHGPRCLHLPRLLAYRALFDPFPNPHIRSNGFMIERATMRALRTGRIVSKRAAHCFEAGRHSLTKQVAAMGLRPLIVGRDGVGYERDDWPYSRSFRQGEQENLLIADNRSEAYQHAGEQQRERLARTSWGEHPLIAGKVVPS